MDFTNERYVCLYVRDTTTWKRLPWQSRLLLPNILRKCDRAGLLDLEGMTPAACVALHVDLPIEFLIEALPPLFRPMDPNDPTTAILHLTPTAIFWPRFADGQDTAKSDKQRQRESRENRALKAKLAVRTATQSELFAAEASHAVTDPVELGLPVIRSRMVTGRPNIGDSSQRVTDSVTDQSICHDVTPDVTPAELSEPAELNRAEPNSAEVQQPSNLVHFRRPLPSEPAGLPPAGPPLWRQILKWHADAFAEALAGLSPPRHTKRDEAAKRVAEFCEQSASAYRTTPEALAQRVIEGLFQSNRAAQSRFPIGFAANDPAEYLPPPPGAKPPPKPVAKSNPKHNPGGVSEEHESELPTWMLDAPAEAAQ